MKLALTIAAASAILRFDAPGEGSYLVFSSSDGGRSARVEASNYVWGACRVNVRREAGGTARIYWVWWQGARGAVNVTTTTKGE